MNRESWLAQARANLAGARARRDAFVQLAATTPAAEAAHAYDRIRAPLDLQRGWAGLFAQVHSDAAIRSAAMELEQEYSSFETALSLDREVYEGLSRIPRTDLAGADLRAVEHAIRDYKRSGVDRDEATRARIQALSDELVKVGQAFDQAIVSDVRRVRLPQGVAAFEGLPADWIRSHPPDADGSVTVTTDPPDFVPFLCYAKDHAARHALYAEYTNRGYPANLANLAQILELRHEFATLLGAESYADYVTGDKMVRTARAAREFIERIGDEARSALDRELGQLLAEKRRVDPGASEIHDWERAYWIERVKSERLSFDSQSVRPYFAYANVVRGVLEISAELYGVRFEKNSGEPGWHPSVECYDVIEQSGERLARFWLDMHPRPDKYKHAAMFPLRAGLAGEAQPEACLVCNFSQPSAADPALLQHREVTTFFHEFGHLLHHLFAGRGRHLCFSGIATEWDFVEVPSQLYEEWAWDPAVLARFAKHHASGEALPPELARRLRAVEEFGKGMQVAQQMFYARLALAYHEVDPRGLDTTARMVELKRAMLPFPYEEGTHFQCSFGHLHGYSATYYTYMWSLVIAKDLHSRFRADSMDTEVAREYRAKVLAPGGSKDAAVLVEDFLGRPYSIDAWRRWLEA
ncbi:MAG: M3 family metallopeptidase [Planctomycetota bacterium]